MQTCATHTPAGKFLAIVMALALIIGLLPGMTLTAAAVDNIILSADLPISGDRIINGIVTISDNVTLTISSGATLTIIGTADSKGAIEIGGNKTLTVTGGGTLDVTAASVGSGMGGKSGIYLGNGGSLIVDGATVMVKGGDASDAMGGRGIESDNGSVIVKSGSLTTQGGNQNSGDGGFGTSLGPSSSVTVTGGELIASGGIDTRAITLSTIKGQVAESTDGVTYGAPMVKTSSIARYVKVTPIPTPVATVKVGEANAVEYTVFNDDDSDAANDAVHAWLAAEDGAKLTLLANVETSTTIAIASGSKVLDLNGYGILMIGDSAVVVIREGASLTLRDDAETKPTHYLRTGGLRARTVSDTASDDAVAVVGGYIAGGNSAYAGGVMVQGGCVFTMEGGTITGNLGGQGGGVYVANGINTGTFIMSGGAIVNNTASYDGGGVYVAGGYSKQSYDPAIFKVSGEARITGNSTRMDEDRPEVVSNVSLHRDSFDNEEDYRSDYDAVITIEDTLSSGASIGVTLAKGHNGVFTSGLTAENAETYASCFFGDNGDDAIVETAEGASQNQLKLGKAPIYYTDHEVDVGTGAVTATTKSTTDYTAFSAGVNSTLTTIPAGWYVIRSGEAVATNRLSISGTVNLILCDGARLIADKGIKVGSNDTLNIFVGNTTNKIVGTGMLRAAGSDGAAGIGGLRDMSGGTVNIHGGVVIAVGTENAMGIGRGYGADMKNGTLTIAPGLYIYGGATEPVSYIEAGNGGAYTGDRYRYMIVNNVAPKTPQEIATQDVTATYGDTDVSVNVALAGNGAITYAVKAGSEEYIAVDASNGVLTIKGVPADGKAYVIVTAAETNEGGTNNMGYAKATKEVPITIGKAELTVKAKDQSIYVGGAVPTLGADSYTVTGLVGTDTLTVNPTLVYQKNGSAVTPTSSAIGTYDIVPSGAEAGNNYAISYANGTLTINNQPAPSPAPSYDGGGFGGGGGGVSTPTTATVTIPVSGDSSSVSVSVTISGETATVSDGNLDSVLSAAADTGTVTIDVSGTGKEITEAVLPTTMVEKIIDAVADENNDANGLEVKLSTGTVTFDAMALEAISDQMSGRDLRLNLDDIGTNGLNAAQKTATESLDVQQVYDAYMTSNNQRISDFRGGVATVSIPYTLKDGQVGRGLGVWHVADNGERTEMPTTYVDGAVEFTTTHFSNYVLVYDETRAGCPQDYTCPIAAFTDADPVAWYHDGVHFVLENGIMSGYGDGRFGPNDTTTRAMMAQILWNLENQALFGTALDVDPAGWEFALGFADVDQTAWYADAVNWIIAHGIMVGDEHDFWPSDPISREQLVTIVHRYALLKGLDVSVGEDTNILSYVDAFDVADWAKAAMQWAIGSGVITGRPDGTLDPQTMATRAEIATIMQRFVSLMNFTGSAGSNS